MDVRRLAKKDERVTSKCDGDHPQEPNQISVIFQRDAKGYGLTVCGDNPVFVQFVTENGPAAAAGLQPFDRIIRVNGVFVTKSNHVEVVALIKSIPYVAMTVVRTPPVKDPSGSQMVTGSSPEVSVSRSNSRDYALKEARLVHLGRQLEEEVQVLKNFQVCTENELLISYGPKVKSKRRHSVRSIWSEWLVLYGCLFMLLFGGVRFWVGSSNDFYREMEIDLHEWLNIGF